MSDIHANGGSRGGQKNDLTPDSAYDALCDKLDAFHHEVQTRNAQEMKCGAGCSDCCCHHLSVFGIEAARVTRAVRALDPGMRDEVTARARALRSLPVDGPCPLLLLERCSVYEARPLLCRAQGLGMITRDPDTDVAGFAVCELNFVDAPPRGEDLLDLDRLNTSLAAVATLWSRARDRDPRERVPLARAALDAVESPFNSHE